MTFHNHRTPRPAAVPPAARGLPGPVTRALRKLTASVAMPKDTHPPRTPEQTATLADALMNLRAADPAFDANPELRALRKALAGRIRSRLAGVEADIAALDMLGGDPDLEATGDDEPSLCGIGGHEPFGHMASISLGGCNYGTHPYDIEADDADGPEGDDEREPDVDDEPTLCGVTCNSLFATGPAMASGESEPSLASLGGTADGCEGSQEGWAKGDQTDREVDTGSRTHSQDGLWREPGPALTEARDRARRLRMRRRDGGVIVPGIGFVHAVIAIGGR